MSKINIDEAFGVVCKRLDDYDTFLQMVRMMREAQKHSKEITTTFENFTQLEEADKKMQIIEESVDNWLKREYDTED